jgi:glycosyltransferase involved in cell wall biosynthesis
MEQSILILSGVFPPDSGGPAKFASTFQHWLNQKKQIATVLTLVDGPSQQVYSNNSSLIRISRDRNLLFRITSTVFWLGKLQRTHSLVIANGLFIEIAILSFFMRLNYSVKIPGDIVWERARNCKYTNLDVEKFQSQKLNMKYRIFRFLFLRSIKGAIHVIVPSKQLGELCRFWGVSKEKITVIHNSVDTSFFFPNSSSLKKYDVISVSRLVKWKCIDEIIHACVKLKASLLIVGTGPEEEKLRQLADDLKGNISFVGDVSQMNLPSLYQESKLFALNSDFEATSYSLLEARSCGLPTIARGGTGSDEIINSGVDGFLCGPETGISLEVALQELLEDSKKAELFAKIARLSVLENFNMESNYQKILDVISGIQIER